MKMSLTPEALCQGLPTEFATYLSYCRQLAFEEEPDYNHLRGLFLDLLAREGYDPTRDQFDWFLTYEHVFLLDGSHSLIILPRL